MYFVESMYFSSVCLFSVLQSFSCRYNKNQNTNMKVTITKFGRKIPLSCFPHLLCRDFRQQYSEAFVYDDQQHGNYVRIN